MENPIKMDDLWVPLFLETPILRNLFGHQLVIKGAAWPQNGRRLMVADLLDPFGAPKRLSLSDELSTETV